MDTIRVLHVDAEPTFGDLVSEVLEREDDRIEVVTEASADDGISRVASEQQRIDAVDPEQLRGVRLEVTGVDSIE